MGINYRGQVANGPTPGTPPPPTVSTPGADEGGRPPTGGGTNLSGTMAKWRQGIFSQPGPSATMPQPSPTPGAGGRTGGSPPSGSLQPRPATTAPSSQMGAPAPPGAAGMMPGTGVPGTAMLPTMPQPQEVDQLPPGSYETPLGTLVKSPDGTAKVMLNPEGQEQYRKRFAESVQAMGKHPFSNDPNAPPPPVSPGRVSYNPFSDQFSDAAPKPPGVA